ncbi:MAG: LytR/AlgR family response regulator transcription factor [Owenweeksia sp.]
MKVSAIIIDDEPDARNLIALYLQQLFPQVQLVKQAENVAQAHEYLCHHRVDMMFLDIQLPDGSGFNLLQKLEGQHIPHIIFVTSYDEYAIKAIKVAALDYILKPVSKEDIREAVTQVLQKIVQLSQSSVKPDLSRIALPSLTGLEFIEIDEISCCEADNNYTTLYLKDGAKKVVTKTLSRFETELSAYNFLRVHHKYLVNLKMVKSYSKGKGGGHLVMQNNDTIPVSSRRKHLLMEAFTH